MTTIAELERSLQTTWDPALLAVYADALQAAGDPRGELIALDLHIAAHGRTRELEARRRERVFAWLGGRRLTENAAWISRWCTYGLIDELERWSSATPAYFAALAATPAVRYLRSATITDRAEELGPALERFCALGDHPWLRGLRLHSTTWSNDDLAPGLGEAIVRVAPHLDTLGLVVKAFTAMPFHHPALRCLDLQANLDPGDGVIDPNVEEIRLPFPSLERPLEENFARFLHGFPALRRVALWESGKPWRLPIDAIPERVEVLRIPPPADPTIRPKIVALVLARPNLRLELVGGFSEDARPLVELGHPRIHDRGTHPFPSHLDPWVVWVGGVEVSLPKVVGALKAQFHRLDETERIAWRELWDAVRCGSTTIRGDTVFRAFDALEETFWEHDEKLRAFLDALDPGGDVTLEIPRK